MKRIEKNWIKKDSSQKGWIEKGLKRIEFKRIVEIWIKEDSRELD